jgi:Rrf2 family protein
MQYSKGTSYALHVLVFLVVIPKGTSIGAKELAAYQGVSETYLSKILTKLRKANLVRSSPGAKGGYELAQGPEDITFWDVVKAIEGNQPLYTCSDYHQHRVHLFEEMFVPEEKQSPCLIERVMQEAEKRMKEYLQEKNIAWVYDQTSPETKEKMNEWLLKKKRE